MKKGKKKKKEWILKDIRIDLITYGDDAGKYKGMVEFQTGVDTYESENITLKIPADKLNKYKDFIAEDLANSCNQLVANLQNAFLNKEAK